MPWRENKWAVIGAIAGLAGPLVGVLLFVMERRSKEISVSTVAQATVADLSDPALSVLKLTFKDVPVNRVTTATIEVANVGSVPVEPRDFERPLAIWFTGPSKLLAVTVGEKSPSNLSPQISHDTGRVTVAPMLLNPSDRFRLSAHLAGGFSEPQVDARISGIPKISRALLNDPASKWKARAVVIVSGLGACMSYGFLVVAFNPFSRRRPKVVMIPYFVGGIMAVFASVVATMLGMVVVVSFETQPVSRPIVPVVLTAATIVVGIAWASEVLQRRVYRQWSVVPRSQKPTLKTVLKDPSL